jgi:hypothetical protein
VSTYYAIVCNTHMERLAVAKENGGGCSLLKDCETVAAFVVAHRGCAIRILSEHDEDYYAKP